MIRKILCWDIDGTLLTTARAGITAWENSYKSVSHRSFSFENFQTMGLTDVEIATKLAMEIGDASDNIVKKLIVEYENQLPYHLPSKKGYVFPGVFEVLNQLKSIPDIYSMLLTGNTRRGAAAKLTYYGLNHFFQLGAFADGLPDRPSIAERAIQIATQKLTLNETREFFVIGDTPHDIHCGKSIHAKTVAICTGVYDRETLLDYHPWLVLDSLADTNIFFKSLGISC